MGETFNETDNPTDDEVVDALNDPNFTPPAEDGPRPTTDTPKEGQDRRVRVPSPTYLPETQQVVIPVVHGVGYRVNNKPVSGALSLDEARSVTAVMENGHRAAEGSQLSWTFSPVEED